MYQQYPWVLRVPVQVPERQEQPRREYAGGPRREEAPQPRPQQA